MPASIADDNPKSREGLARELIRVTGAVASTDQMMAACSAQISSAFPIVPAELWDELLQSFDANEMMELVVPIYTKHYSAEELAGLVEFYQTPLGKRVIEVTADIMQESPAIGMAWGQQKAAEVIESLQARGYEPVNV